MAFLDNAGDIILDAVLTDIGRKRMAEGNFQIETFALGDDEIDYGLYDANHTSGSAYYDLEILQTPIFEASTKRASSIKYGLMSVERTDILYMPSLKVNTKITEAIEKYSSSGVYLLAANSQTYQNLVSLIGDKYVLDPIASAPPRFFVLESGIDTLQRVPTVENRKSMIVDTGLLDSNLEIKFDYRFVSGIRTVVDGKFANNPSDGGRDIRLNNFQGRAANSTSEFLENYSSAFSLAMPNMVVKVETGVSDTSNSLSEFAGPRGMASAFSLSPTVDINVQGSVTPAYYTLYGKTGLTETQLGIGAGSNLYDIIDTTIYVTGTSSGANLQIPLRIVRLQG